MIGLALLLSSACGYGFEVLDTTDREWVAPGYKTVEEICIDPMDYAESLISTTDAVACQVFFVDVDGIERWRVVIVGYEGVTVLQEKAEQRHIALNFPATGGVNFSPDGRYLMARERVAADSSPTSECDAALVALETEAVTYFSTAIFDHSGGFFLPNSGRLVCFAESGIWDMADPVSPVRTTGPGCEYYNASMDPEGNLYCTYFSTDSIAGLLAFNSDGSVEWESPVSGIGWPAIKPGGDLVICALRRGLVFLSGEDGSVVQQVLPNVIAGVPVFSPDGNYWTSSVILEPIPDQTIGRISVEEDLTADDIQITCGSSNDWRVLQYWLTSSNGRVMTWIGEVAQNVGRGERSRNRLAILDSSNQVLWVSRSGLCGGIEWTNSSLDPIMDLGPVCLSCSGDRFAYNDEGLVRVVRIAASGRVR